MLIATDLDGTLLPNGAPGVSARSAAALAMADRAGVPVVFVTARPLRWMEHLWPHVGRQGRAVVIERLLEARDGSTVAGSAPH